MGGERSLEMMIAGMIKPDGNDVDIVIWMVGRTSHFRIKQTCPLRVVLLLEGMPALVPFFVCKARMKSNESKICRSILR